MSIQVSSVVCDACNHLYPVEFENTLPNVIMISKYVGSICIFHFPAFCCLPQKYSSDRYTDLNSIHFVYIINSKLCRCNCFVLTAWYYLQFITNVVNKRSRLRMDGVKYIRHNKTIMLLFQTICAFNSDSVKRK